MDVDIFVWVVFVVIKGKASAGATEVCFIFEYFGQAGVDDTRNQLVGGS